MSRVIAMLIVAFALAACASGSSVITGTKRPAIAPSAVQLYTNPPAEYDVIGIVKASSDAGLTEQGSMDYALEELKRQAAAIGANGVLLRAVGERGGAYYGTYVPNAHSGGYFVGSESLAQTLSGEAIYVLKKE